MEIKEYSIKTSIINSDDGERNFEIVREISGDGIAATEEAILVTICPAISAKGDFKINSTTMHLTNHLVELGFCRVSVINLFSKITQSRMSSRGLTVDEENMGYIEGRMKDKSFKRAKFIIAWGNSMLASEAANYSKQRIIRLFRKFCPKGVMYQLSCTNGAAEGQNAVHLLYLGIHSANSKWILEEYQPPESLMQYVGSKRKMNAVLREQKECEESAGEGKD